MPSSGVIELNWMWPKMRCSQAAHRRGHDARLLICLLEVRIIAPRVFAARDLVLESELCFVRSRILDLGIHHPIAVLGLLRHLRFNRSLDRQNAHSLMLVSLRHRNPDDIRIKLLNCQSSSGKWASLCEKNCSP
jgi:hypothetical protein